MAAEDETEPVGEDPPEFTETGMYSDPYTKVIINGVSKQTAWKVKRLNPRWNEKFVFDINSSDPKQMTAKFEVRPAAGCNTASFDVRRVALRTGPDRQAPLVAGLRP